jgi:arabinogalactan oligomer/maltooligosaccharide transport system substrate-binding protein
MAAMKGMKMLAQSKAYDSNADIFTDAGVVVTGIWNAQAAADHFGENLAATDLPSFTVDGKAYHLGSYSGNKLMGVKPQSDAKRGAVLSQLAQYLTGEKCQNDRFASFEWGPSNVKAQASEAVQKNISLAALAKQNAFATPQGQIGGSWWDIAKVLGADAKNAADDAALKASLDNYDKAIGEWLKLTPEQRRSWNVIGQVNNTNWDTDISMKEEPANTWTATVELPANGEFKIRQGYAWTHNFGADLKDNEGPNFKVEEAGSYKIVFSWDGSNYGDVKVEITKVA